MVRVLIEGVGKIALASYLGTFGTMESTECSGLGIALVFTKEKGGIILATSNKPLASRLHLHWGNKHDRCTAIQIPSSNDFLWLSN